MKIKKKYFILIAVIILIIFTLVNKDVIFQEGNPLPIFKGIIQLNVSNNYVKINNNPITYLTKSNNKNELFGFIEKENSVKFIEQFGSAYLFEGNGKSITMTSKQYTKFYRVWYYSKKNI
ncbi:hypothetical protein J2Z76_003113 [Sedimentibacter acidaminivorans]|jgi:hypothetical protein|uniref:Uncharacterized protein n=1 Tax=Sedimentibacter acidaminivorans TaxID=913099 RepID=A0ABS4GHN7_9FIRM|nr:hypothetical protein [Sedimentibacter acidaminivorans]MBP1927216.1 hypothetical protein [Sedimentibacter acidaminivorans]